MTSFSTSFNNFVADLSSAATTTLNKITDPANKKKVTDVISATHNNIKDVVGNTFGKNHLDFNMKLAYAIPTAIASSLVVPPVMSGFLHAGLAVSLKYFSKLDPETKIKVIQTLAIATIPSVVARSEHNFIDPVLNTLFLGTILAQARDLAPKKAQPAPAVAAPL